MGAGSGLAALWADAVRAAVVVVLVVLVVGGLRAIDHQDRGEPDDPGARTPD